MGFTDHADDSPARLWRSWKSKQAKSSRPDSSAKTSSAALPAGWLTLLATCNVLCLSELQSICSFKYRILRSEILLDKNTTEDLGLR